MNRAEPASILIVDDDQRNCRILGIMLEEHDYRIHTATSAREALDHIKSTPPDLVLLDIMLPGMDGFELAGQLKANPETKSIPVIMVTALNDHESRIRGLDAGAEEFLSKPIDHVDLEVRVRNLLRLKEYSDLLRNHNQILENQVQERTSQLRDSFIDAIHMLMRAAEYRDDETGAHVRRISHYTRTLADALGLDGGFCDAIFYASPMHDVGKIGIPDQILLKPGRFTPQEWELMKTHTTIGQKILSGASSEYLDMGREIALCHHERWDGGGYPQGLKAEEIPLPARIMQICDVYDALRSERPYKPSISHEMSCKIICKGDGRTEPGHFDPEVLSIFKHQCINAFAEIFATCHD